MFWKKQIFICIYDHRQLKSFFIELKDLPILHHHYHGCWWHGNTRSSGFDLVLLEYYDFWTLQGLMQKRFNLLMPWSCISFAQILQYHIKPGIQNYSFLNITIIQGLFPRFMYWGPPSHRPSQGTTTDGILSCLAGILHAIANLRGRGRPGVSTATDTA